MAAAAGNPLKLIELPVAQQDGSPMPAGSAGGQMTAMLPPLSTKAGYWIMALEQDLTTGVAVDYRMTTDAAMGLVHNSSRFGVIAYTEAYGVTGRAMYLVSETGTILRRDPGAEVIVPGIPPYPIQAAYRQYPQNPGMSGWGKLD